MFTPDSSKSIMTRIGTSLKVGVMLVLLGLLVVATERPMLLSPAAAVTAAEDASHRANERAATTAFAYLPAQYPAPSGPIEELPPQF